INESRPNVVDFIINGKLDLIIHTFWGKTMREEEKVIRHHAVQRNVPLVTTLAASRAALFGIEALRNQTVTLKSLQEYHSDIRASLDVD
ncbi:MAG: hypothetical protein V2A74_13450, partial [bacterium]